MIKKLNIGIVGFGGYVPRYRIKIEDIAWANGQNYELIKNAILITEKSVPGKDEDTATIAVAAAKNALARAAINTDEIRGIGAVFVGSESHPYAVKATSAIVGEVLGLGENFTAADTEFACKAGTAAMQMTAGMIEGGMIKYGLAVGADTSQGAPGDALEYSAGAGGAAFLLGKDGIAAKMIYTLSKTSETPDFWRRNLQKYPRHLGRFTGEEAYFKHTSATTKAILNETGFKISDFDHVVFHQPNGKFPLNIAKEIGVSKEQLMLGIVVHSIGNTYSASSMLGLINVLENAAPNQKILLTSYGSGSGSDCFIFETTELLAEKQKKGKKLLNYLNDKVYVDYNQYREHIRLVT